MTWKSGLKVPLLPLGPSALCKLFCRVTWSGVTASCSNGFRMRLDGQHCPLRTYQGVFQGRRNLWGYN